MTPAIEFLGKHWLQNMTWTEVENYLSHDERVLVPVGQTEQHGPHLPMGTDTYVATAIAESVASKTGALIAPPLWYGWAPRMLSFPGSMTLSASTLTDVVTDICNSLITHGFKKLYIINGHRRENLPPIEIACAKVRYSTGAFISILDPLYLGVDEILNLRNGNRNILSHAAGIETAHMLHIEPELVNEHAFEDTPPEQRLNIDQFDNIDRPILYDTPEEFRNLRGERGVRGDVTWATRERGQNYHNAIVDSIVKYIEKTTLLETAVRKPAPIV